MSLPTICKNDELEEVDYCISFLKHIFLPFIIIGELLNKFLCEFTEKK